MLAEITFINPVNRTNGLARIKFINEIVSVTGIPAHQQIHDEVIVTAPVNDLWEVSAPTALRA